MMAEPLMTWNFFLTPALIGALGYFIKKWIDDTQKQASERNLLTVTELSAIKACLTAIKVEMESKIDRKDCEKKGAEKCEVIYHHKHTQDGEVVMPQ